MKYLFMLAVLLSACSQPKPEIMPRGADMQGAPGGYTDLCMRPLEPGETRSAACPQ